jgi:large subunit ribosomal protein L29
MPVGTPERTMENLDAMDNEQLLVEIKKAKEELFNLRFQLATGQLETHGRIKALRKDVARIYTVQKEREYGIRTEPRGVVEDVATAPKGKTADDDADGEEEVVEKPKRRARKAKKESEE